MQFKFKCSVSNYARPLLRRLQKPKSPCSLGIVSEVTTKLLTGQISGVFGLAFRTIATSGAQPFWQSLVDQPGALDEPVMTFHLTRFLNSSHPRKVQPGGSFTIGAINHTLYTGDIDYQNVSGTPSYWSLDVACKCRKSSGMNVSHKSYSCNCTRNSDRSILGRICCCG